MTAVINCEYEYVLCIDTIQFNSNIGLPSSIQRRAASKATSIVDGNPHHLIA